MDKENTLLSVIVPIYNAEKYLTECIASILNQTYKQLDIILVDDGSTDSSNEICRNLCKIDNRLRLIEIENSGPFQARKAGVNVARGEILAFVDADDTLELDAYDELMDIYHEYTPDIIAFNYEYNNESTPKNNYLDGLYLKEEIKAKIIPGMMHDYKNGYRKMEPSIVGKIIKKHLYQKIAYQIQTRITLGEDALVTYPAICMAEKLYITNQVFYHYRKNMDSCTQTCPIERVIEVKSFQDEITHLFRQMGLEEEMKLQVECYVRSFVSMMINSWYGIERSSIMYSFPFQKILQGERIIIYGAGEVGKSFVNELIISDYAQIVGWVDRCYKSKKAYNGYPISAPGELLKKSFDKICIAINSEEVAMQIKAELLDMGIQSEKIVWEQPHMIG